MRCYIGDSGVYYRLKGK